MHLRLETTNNNQSALPKQVPLPKYTLPQERGTAAAAVGVGTSLRPSPLLIIMVRTLYQRKTTLWGRPAMTLLRRIGSSGIACMHWVYVQIFLELCCTENEFTLL
jgi:hypothetical protein